MKIIASFFRMWKLTVPLLLLLVLIIYIRLPRGGEPDVGSQLGHIVSIQNRGQVVCSDDCLDLAQCGYLGNEDNRNNSAVLGHTIAPHLTDHNFHLNSGTNVLVLDSRVQNVRESVWNGETATFNPTGESGVAFYLVQQEETENAVAFWVGGWCLQTIR
jgi:hypothetical protein